MTKIHQRAELTFKDDVRRGRFGWLRLTPAYSVRLVDDILSHSDPDVRVLDPFSGTGTTALCAGYTGRRATGVDLNPFLVWFGNAKVSSYNSKTVDDVRRSAKEIVNCPIPREDLPQCPPIHNVSRWWDGAQLCTLLQVKSAIDKVAPAAGAVRDLLLVAFCRFLINSSNAAFNHQSMSFKKSDEAQLSLFEDDSANIKAYETEVKLVVRGATQNPSTDNEVVLDDARLLTALGHKYNLVVTSPPYPNRMSYIRELRPYMYWLGYLHDKRQAGDLDWRAIGGTWGIATSRVGQWEPKNKDWFQPKCLKQAIACIRKSDGGSAETLSRYVQKYFYDIWHHIQALRRHCAPNAAVHYIVGNSVFYDVLLPVEKIFASMFSELGVSSVATNVLRKRNSKKELYEFDVVAHMPN